jgi:hypothetical protein
MREKRGMARMGSGQSEKWPGVRMQGSATGTLRFSNDWKNGVRKYQSLEESTVAMAGYT